MKTDLTSPRIQHNGDSKAQSRIPHKKHIQNAQWPTWACKETSCFSLYLGVLRGNFPLSDTRAALDEMGRSQICQILQEIQQFLPRFDHMLIMYMNLQYNYWITWTTRARPGEGYLTVVCSVTEIPSCCQR